jgi:hypothetical protein
VISSVVAFVSVGTVALAAQLDASKEAQTSVHATSDSQSSGLEAPTAVRTGVFILPCSDKEDAAWIGATPNIFTKFDPDFLRTCLKKNLLLVTSPCGMTDSASLAASSCQSSMSVNAIRTVCFESIEQGTAQSSDATRDVATMRALIGPSVQQGAIPKDSPSHRWWRMASIEFTPIGNGESASPIPVQIPSSGIDPQADAISWQQIIGTQREWRAASAQHARAASILRSLESGEQPSVLSAQEHHEVALNHPPTLGASVLEVVSWIELVDAMQARCRIANEIEIADRLRADLRAYLLALRVSTLAALLDERVPIGSSELVALSMHATWESDAWPLLQASIGAFKNQEDARARFAQLALRVGTKVGFSKEAIEWLQNRLDRVAKNLPSNFQWDAAFEQAVSQHLEDAFQEGAMFDGVYRAPGFDVNDLDICRIYAQTAAFEVFGYAWSRDGALSQSQQSARALQFEALLSPIRDAAAGDRFLVGQHDFAELASAQLFEMYSRDEAKWKPWLVFPMRDPSLVTEVSAELLENLQRESTRFAENIASSPFYTHTPRLDEAYIHWPCNRIFGNGYDRLDGLPWIMDDLSSLFWDGYVALRR